MSMLAGKTVRHSSLSPPSCYALTLLISGILSDSGIQLELLKKNEKGRQVKHESCPV